MPTSPTAAPLSPAERRKRNREETTQAILDTARAVMQEHGVAALNLNEVARRVRMRPQSLSEYFPNKTAVYDALITQSLTLFREGDEAAYRDHPPGWAQIEAWFANRISFATANPDLYHLSFEAPVVGYVFPGHLIEAIGGILARAREMVSNAIAVGAMDPGMPVDQATDILLAMRRGLIAERIGKARYQAPGADRFDRLLLPVLHILKTAWTPASVPTSPAPSEGDAHA